jgi:hypothetical protein
MAKPRSGAALGVNYRIPICIIETNADPKYCIQQKSRLGLLPSVVDPGCLSRIPDPTPKKMVSKL